MALADPGAAAEHFFPFAAMSALAYEEANSCPGQQPTSEKKKKRKADVAKQRRQIRSLLAGWEQDKFPDQPACDDEMGLFYRVWTRGGEGRLDVVLAFRGTGGTPDWIRGNLRWLTRFWPGPDQYDRSREIADRVIAHYRDAEARSGSGREVHFFTTGHSLGGGLAQAVYYHRPDAFDQVYAFDPSPVTGYMEECPETRRQGCLCKLNWEREARIYRIYESNEILAWVRLPLKLVLPLHRHIQEVRFDFAHGNGVLQHNMADFTLELHNKKSESKKTDPWYAGAGNAEDGKTTCTQMFEARQEKLCKQPRTDKICP
jgi:pimeloyl-ACP methyl ester carboxylesterase